MTQRAALYGRYSTDKQSDSSIPDQHRECQQLAARHGFEVVAKFDDAAISGGTAQRPGYQAMLAAARRREFSVIVAEDSSRLWRNLAEQAPRVAELRDLGVDIVTFDLDTRSESAVMLGAVLGAMSEGYRQEIARRTHRGLKGKALAGKSAGGRAYGYTPAAQSGTGQIEIDPAQAAIVLRIFTLYADGASPRAIAEVLNAEEVPSPGSFWKRVSRRKSKWMASAINGDPVKGLGILNNALYTGLSIWGKERWTRLATDSSKRRRVAVPEAEWIKRQDERLRIIPDELWQRVKARQRHRSEGLGLAVVSGLRAKRKLGKPARYLLSGLLKCPTCGSSYSVGAHGLYTCASFTGSGPSACKNGTRFKRTDAEHELLAGLRDRMLRPDAIAELRERVVKIMRAQAEPPKPDRAAQIAALEGEVEKLVNAIATHGITSPAIAQRLQTAETSLARLRHQDDPAPVRRVEKLLPGLLERHRRFVADLGRRLAEVDPDMARAELRRLFGPVTARPHGGVVRLEIEDQKFEQTLVRACGGAAQVADGNLVAGAGFEPATFGL